MSSLLAGRSKVYADFKPGPTIAYLKERQEDLERFATLYEDLVDLLCGAAQFGATEKLERIYASIPKEYMAQYNDLRPFLISFLEFAPIDEQAGLKLRGRPLDAFEALVAASNLEEFIATDDGNMISRLTRTHAALNRYREHLRMLAARVL